MELTEAREILEDIGLADAITPDLQVATEVVLARVDELENVVSAYRKGQPAPAPAPARDTDAPEDYSETCECSLCSAYRNNRRATPHPTGNAVPQPTPPPVYTNAEFVTADPQPIRWERWNGADAMQRIAPEPIGPNWSPLAVTADDVRNVI